MQGGLDIRSRRLFEDRFSAVEIAVWMVLVFFLSSADNLCKQNVGPDLDPNRLTL